MATTTFYRTPHLTAYSFGLGILLFLLPFAEIKCSGTSIASLKGIDLVTGASPKINSDLENIDKQFGNNANEPVTTTDKKKDGKMYVAALLALLLGIAGLLVALRKKTGYSMAEVVLGVTGAIALIVLMIQVNADVNSQLKNEKGNDGFSSMIKASVDFTFWFFLCLFSYLASAFFSYRQKENGNMNRQPSTAAPQVAINNPGDQSDFPAAPSAEEGLG